MIVTEPRTETEALEQRITTSLATIRRTWPHMLPTGPAPIRYGTGRSAGIVSDNSTPRRNHRGQPYWPADHLDDAPDVDTTTRLVSLRRDVTDSLNGWSRVIVEDRPVHKALPDGTDPEEMCTFLERHAQWMSGHEAASDMAEELDRLARDVRRYAPPPITDKPRPATWRIGACPLEVEREQGMEVCGGDVRYREDYRDAAGEAMPRCASCGVAAVASWWEDRMYDDPELRKMLTYDDVATLAHRILGRPVHRATVKMWASRGVIEPSGQRDDKGRVLFARDAVVYAIDLWKRKPA